MNYKEFVWCFQTWGSLFLAKTLDWLQTCYTLIGHICNVLNASAKDCSISRNQQHTCNNPPLLGRIRIYWIGTRTTVQYSEHWHRITGVPEILLLLEHNRNETIGEIFFAHNSRPSLYKHKHSLPQLHVSIIILLLALDWLHLQFLYFPETKNFDNLCPNSSVY